MQTKKHFISLWEYNTIIRCTKRIESANQRFLHRDSVGKVCQRSRRRLIVRQCTPPKSLARWEKRTGLSKSDKTGTEDICNTMFQRTHPKRNLGWKDAVLSEYGGNFNPWEYNGLMIAKISAINHYWVCVWIFFLWLVFAMEDGLSYSELAVCSRLLNLW